ncbi:UNVERIFIED_CONTAM: hypothetical protein RMT77_008574 [Armadillidium vulgare]|nr:hypothetical protein Avbf_13061 [Armadillidium vulgare]
MIQSLSYTEMNHAVPGSYVTSFSPRMEHYFECEVPSPSHWSDLCRSPPSFHSPTHCPSDLEKLKEEPLSPCAATHFSLLQFNRPMSREDYENSISLTELLEENASLVKQHPQASYHQQQQQQLQEQHQLHQQLQQQQQQQQPNTKLDEEPYGGSEYLDNIKKETTEQEVTSVLFDYGSPSSSSTTTCSPYLSVTTTVSQPQVAVGDSLRTVELMALDYYRQYVQKVSIKLGIAKDPIAWSSNDVILWLKYEAEQQGLPPPSFLSSWNMTGLDLCRLTEAQFREMIPHGGELYFAKLEIWREALRTSYQADVSIRHTLSSSMIPHLQYLHPNVTHSPPPMQPLTVHIQPPGPPQHHQMYQSPTSTTSFSPPGMMLSPIPPPLIQMSPSPSPSPRHSQNSNMPSSSSSSPPPPIQVPTPVIQMEQQQLQGQHEHQNKIKVIPKKLQRFSPTPTASCSKTESPPKQQQTKQYFDSTFVEKCANVTTLLKSAEETNLETQTQVETPDESVESEDEGDKESTSGTGGNRGGTHIHLWQFLKELLLHPQLYGSCIRWLDRSKGVFKIEDSVRVARLWGKRKNRPAMNYDKLSRSIRQYYKKNIMKKTERSQRLVYQFCHPYGL